MKFHRLFYIWTILIMLSAPARAEMAAQPVWGDGSLSQDVQKTCAGVDSLTIPEKDYPSDSEKASFKGCSSADLYYGIGRPVDYVAARKCALIEDEGVESDVDVFSGQAILMMIYANGQGVTKNPDLATQMACNTDGAVAEIEGRVKHIQEIKSLKPGQTLKLCRDTKGLSPEYCHGVFDFCDDVTSGMMSGYCSSLSSRMKEAKALPEFRRIVYQWPEADKKAFKDLDEAASAYFDAHAENEMDLSGTARAMFEIEEKDTFVKHFRDTIIAYEKGRLPKTTAKSFVSADKNLNVAYGHIVNNARFLDGSGISKDSIKTTQRLWIKYRDAWIRFAAIHYPGISPDNLKSALTQERIETMKAIPLDE